MLVNCYSTVLHMWSIFNRYTTQAFHHTKFFWVKNYVFTESLQTAKYVNRFTETSQSG